MELILGKTKFTNFCFLLKRNVFNEADEKITLFSYSKGKIYCTARAIKKQGSTIRGAVQPLCLSKYTFMPTGYNVFKITGADIIFNAFDLIYYPALFNNCMKGFFFLDKILPFSTPEPKIFALTCNYLKLFMSISKALITRKSKLKDNVAGKQNIYETETLLILISYEIKCLIQTGTFNLTGLLSEYKRLVHFLTCNSFIEIFEKGQEFLLRESTDLKGSSEAKETLSQELIKHKLLFLETHFMNAFNISMDIFD
jgi:hypothetical protein